MKTYIENITLINNYIEKSLTIDETKAFENRLKTDLDFQDLYNEQMALLQGVKRAGLKAEIHAAKQGYLQFKWLKISGISLSCLVVLFLAWMTFFNTSEIEVIKPNPESKTVKEIDNNEAKETQQNEISIATDNIVLEDVKTEKPTAVVLKEETQITAQEQNDITEIVISDDSVKTTEVITSLEDVDYVFGSLFKSVKKKPQVVEVNTEQEFSITLKEGTKLNIPKHAFVNSKTGKLVRGIVQLEVTEYYKLSDMLLADLSTTSNGELLETGGMLFIEAKKDDNALELKKPISMAFPFKTKKPNMQMFNGDGSREIIDWVPENNEVKAIVDEPVQTIAFLEGNVEVPFDVVENVPVFPSCGGGTNEELKVCFNKKMYEYFNQNFNLEVAKELGLTGINRINMFFKIESNGKIYEAYVRSSSVILGNEALRVIRTYPKFRPALQRGKPVRVPYFMPFVFELPGATKNLKMITVGNADNSITNNQINSDSISVDHSKDLNPNDFNAYEVSSYALSSANLGWLNCDAFVRDGKQKMKFKFKLKNGDGANVKMVFKSMSAILPSKSRSQDVDFGFVPKDEEVVLIAVKKVDNTFYLGIKETLTTEISELNFDFKPVTVEELKQEMINLNDMFN